MRNLFRMYLYEMRRSRGSWVMLILAFASGLVMTPIVEGFTWLLELSGDDPAELALIFPSSSKLSGIIGNPFPLVNAMLMFLSAFMFFCMDSSRGFIKNTIGLMPKRAHSYIAEFCAVMVHNALFMLAGVLGNLVGTVPFRQILFDGGIPEGILLFLTKYMLALSLTALIMLLAVAKGSKGLGIVTCIILGNRVLMLAWELISMGVRMLFKNERFSLIEYMPDQMICATEVRQPYAILIAIGLLALLLPLAVRVFEKRDLK